MGIPNARQRQNKRITTNTPKKNLPSEISITSPIDMVPKMRFIVASDSGLGTIADSGFPPACAGVVKVDDAPVAA